MRIPTERIVLVKPYVGKEAILGIRPGHIRLAPKPDNASVSGGILVKEEMGHEVIVYFDEQNSGQMIARLTSDRGRIAVREREEAASRTFPPIAS